MPLLNYTTKVPVARTLVSIRATLVKAGARQITETYDDDGHPTGMTFAIETPGGWREFCLPVRSNAVHAVLVRQANRYPNPIPRRLAQREHARRVAWRILKDWIEAQLALIQSEMFTLTGIMLPYMRVTTEGKTLYEIAEQSGFLLPVPSEKGNNDAHQD